MRTIKFRAWIKPTELSDGIMAYPNDGSDYIMISNGDGFSIIDGEKQYLEKDSFVIMQYTGLKDKNGKEIYEGDIVNSWAGLKTNDTYIREVVIDEDEPRIRFNPNTGFILCQSGEQMFEVIGNKFENPGLLD